MLLPLIYTEKLPSFGFSQLRIVAPRALTPKPPKFVTASRQTVRLRPVFNAGSLVAPNVNRLRAVQLLHDEIDAPSGSEVPTGLLPYDGAVRNGMPDVSKMAYSAKAQEPPASVQPPKQPDPPTRRLLQVGGDVQAARIVRKVIPAYPALARQARVQGTVKLESVIAVDGAIQQLRVVSGHPLLVGAAVEAVRQWVYRPTMLNGSPVEVSAPIEVHFRLAQ